MKRTVKMIAGCLAVMMVFMMVGCGQNKLSDKFDEETVKEEAMKAIAYFNERDYQSIVDMGNETFQNAITAEQFAEAGDPYLDKCGEFKEIKKTVVAGNKDQNTGMEYGGVVMIGEYADGKIQFTIAFDEEMKLAQFVIK